MNKIKIIHVHGDIKFFKLSNSFDSPEFENTIVFIGKKVDYDLITDDKIVYFERKVFKVDHFVDYCKNADLIVFYAIDIVATRIILALPKNIKIGWRFFGFELYSRCKESFITKNTKLLIDEEIKIEVEKELIKKRHKNRDSFIINLKQKLHSILFPKKDDFLQAITRCDLFFGLFEEEHNMLKGFFPNLPTFIPISIDALPSISPVLIDNKVNKKENYILVGNSRNYWNNHFEILEIIKKTKSKVEFKTMLFLNYGYEGIYYKKLLEFAKKLNQVIIIEDFLSIEEFNKLSRNCAALVLNSKRQLAGNNIRKAFEYGTKVYLHENNLFFKYFKDNGFVVFSVSDFEKDYETGNLILDNSSAQNNYQKLLILIENNSHLKFQKNIKEYFKKN
jgi:dTDP-N-acetylfucosamine:lipid II N-acetylfucosaminyltransferase